MLIEGSMAVKCYRDYLWDIQWLGYPKRQSVTEPVSYDTLTLPTPRELAEGMTIALLSLGVLHLASWYGWSVDSMSGAVAVTAGLVLITPVYLLVRRPRLLPARLLGEFRFRPYHLTPHASIQRVINPLNERIPFSTYGLTGTLFPGDYVVEILLTVRGSDGEKKCRSYAKVDRLVAEQSYPGMNVTVRYRISRLHPSRIQVKSAW
jgi:hypothetical protein